MEGRESDSALLSFSYGQGQLRRGTHRYDGQIILSEHKLYLKSDKGELTGTFIPLEKVYQIKSWGGTLTIDVRPSTFMHFRAIITGQAKQIRSLTRDIIDKRQLKKKMFGLKWVDPEFIG